MLEWCGTRQTLRVEILIAPYPTRTQFVPNLVPNGGPNPLIRMGHCVPFGMSSCVRRSAERAI